MNRLLLLIPVLFTLVALLGTASGLHWFGWGGTPEPLPPPSLRATIGGPFSLTAPDGHTVTERDFRGRWMLVYFGYTNCPDTCPTALNDIAQALDLLGPGAKDVAPIFITVDPGRDTPTAMGAYTAKFDRRILGLTGTPEQIAKVKSEYHVYAEPAAHPVQGGMVMDHSSVIVVMNPQGQFADALNGDADAATIAAKLRALDH